jgi:hypothetical protein
VRNYKHTEIEAFLHQENISKIFWVISNESNDSISGNNSLEGELSWMMDEIHLEIRNYYAFVFPNLELIYREHFFDQTHHILE